MPCDKCRKKGIPLTCNYCPGKYCSRCINLEEHMCEGIKLKSENDLKFLEKKLVTIIAPKVVKL